MLIYLVVLRHYLVIIGQLFAINFDSLIRHVDLNNRCVSCSCFVNFWDRSFITITLESFFNLTITTSHRLIYLVMFGFFGFIQLVL